MAGGFQVSFARATRLTAWGNWRGNTASRMGTPTMSCYESPSAKEHRDAAPPSVACGVLTVSDTRTQADDKSGATIAESLEKAGHRVVERRIVRDERDAIQQAVREVIATPGVEAILITGGTGIAARDQTPDAIHELLTKELPGFGELFRMLSFQEIGAAAMLSRALGGVIDRAVVLLMPGSTAAVRLAMDRLVLPELGHLVEHARR
jgi:molybdenum cofactor biosynthesis protein B